MAIKRKISKADFEALADGRKELYKENPNRKGEYILDMDDADNELVSALDAVKKERDTLQSSLDALTTEHETLKADKSKSKGDPEALEALKKSYETKLAKAATDAAAAADKSAAQIKRLLVDKSAQELATKISKVPSLMAKAIRERLDIDASGDEPKLTVLDVDGKPSAFTLADLEQELVANKDYADIIIASKASGGNTGNRNAGGGNAPLNDKPRLLTEMSLDELQASMAAKVAKE